MISATQCESIRRFPGLDRFEVVMESDYDPQVVYAVVMTPAQKYAVLGLGSSSLSVKINQPYDFEEDNYWCGLDEVGDQPILFNSMGELVSRMLPSGGVEDEDDWVPEYIGLVNKLKEYMR